MAGTVYETLAAPSSHADEPKLLNSCGVVASITVGLVNKPFTSRRVSLENDDSSFVAFADGYFKHRYLG
jgi:hypothetical protein